MRPRAGHFKWRRPSRSSPRLSVACLASLAQAAYHAHMTPSEDPETLRARLLALQVEHRDLDQVIQQLTATPPLDQLLLQRLKKRKLGLKDRIAFLEQLLEPDIPA
jgi:hypothetical protein